jgi:hypothetical protein
MPVAPLPLDPRDVTPECGDGHAVDANHAVFAIIFPHMSIICLSIPKMSVAPKAANATTFPIVGGMRIEYYVVSNKSAHFINKK